jgi:hypothetical protein
MFVKEFRAIESEVARFPWATYYITTIYHALQHGQLLQRNGSMGIQGTPVGLERGAADLCGDHRANYLTGMA